MKRKLSRALEHFDKYYTEIYGITLWRSIRLALLCNPKKMFLLNPFYLNKPNLVDQLKRNGAINVLDNLEVRNIEVKETVDKMPTLSNIREVDEFVKATEYVGDSRVFFKNLKDVSNEYAASSELLGKAADMKIIEDECKKKMLPWEQPLFPPNLEIYAYPRGVNFKKLPIPSDKLKTLGFYPMDGSSVLAALHLGVRKGDKVLDMCAAPGGKALVSIFSCLPSEVVLIEKGNVRFERMKYVIEAYCSMNELANKLTLFQGDALEYAEQTRNYFDKVLVDVPCSTDRNAALDSKFHLFQQKNYETRKSLHHLQMKLLQAALKVCKVGGDVIYSTCTLSPMQNDRLVAQVVNEINENSSRYEVQVVNCHSQYVWTKKQNDTSKSDWFRVVTNKSELGQTVLPDLLNNYGPGYFCKIRKLMKQ